jgi:uncharacterized membrane protein YhaH (DUF805 family)
LIKYLTSATRAVQKCLQNYAVFQGRASQSEFGYMAIFTLFSLILLTSFSDILGTIFTLAFLLPAISAAVRRMHDRNKEGWYVLIPLLNIYLLATPGDSGNNRFGGKSEKF